MRCLALSSSGPFGSGKALMVPRDLDQVLCCTPSGGLINLLVGHRFQGNPVTKVMARVRFKLKRRKAQHRHSSRDGCGSGKYHCESLPADVEGEKSVQRYENPNQVADRECLNEAPLLELLGGEIRMFSSTTTTCCKEDDLECYNGDLSM